MTHSERGLSAAQRHDFARDGLLVLHGFYDLDRDVVPVQRGIYDVIGQVMERHGVADLRPPFESSGFDVGYVELIRRDRSWGAEIYDAVKQIPAFVRLVAHPEHESLMRDLRPGSVPGIAGGGFGIRIDNPHEDRFRAHWHQEYPAQLRSMDGLVMWSPLVPITAEIGPVKFCLGSHHEGAQPVVTSDPGDSDRTGAYALRLRDEAALLSRYPQTEPLCRPGDLLLVDFLLLHASGHNRAARSRWSMQFRYFNFADPVGRRHGWQGSYAAGIDFRTVHPELSTDIRPEGSADAMQRL